MVWRVSPVELLRTYTDLAPHLEALGRQMSAWLEARSGALGVQVVDMRVKSSDSLARKLSRPDRTYRRLEDVTDVLGLRVVTLFEDEVDVLAARLQSAGMPIIREHGVDKRKLLEPSTFGYRSLHVICTAPADLEVHPLVKTWPFELQLRSVLQHAWAEVEHGLGYKAHYEVPAPFRRRLARVAGLLELADAEFLELRRSKERYDAEVRDLQALQSETITLDAQSLSALVRSSRVGALDDVVAEHLGKPLSQTPYHPAFLLRLLKAARLKQPRQVLERLRDFQAALPDFLIAYGRFVQEHTGFDIAGVSQLDRGYALHLLAHWEAAQQPESVAEREERLIELFLATDHPEDSAAAEESAKALLRALRDPVLGEGAHRSC